MICEVEGQGVRFGVPWERQGTPYNYASCVPLGSRRPIYTWVYNIKKGNTCYNREDRKGCCCSFPAALYSINSPWPLFSVIRCMNVNQELANLQYKSHSLTDFFFKKTISFDLCATATERKFQMTYRALSTCSPAPHKKFANPNPECDFLYFFYVEACLIASEF